MTNPGRMETSLVRSLPHLTADVSNKVFFTDTIHVPEDSEAVIVLALLDKRYFSALSGCYTYYLDFTVYPKDDPANPQGPQDVLGRSVYTSLSKRSVNLELEQLKKGDYVVHVRDLHLLRSDAINHFETGPHGS